MNDPRLDALERMTHRIDRRGGLTAALLINLALIMRNAKLITEEEYEDFKRKCEMLESA